MTFERPLRRRDFVATGIAGATIGVTGCIGNGNGNGNGDVETDIEEDPEEDVEYEPVEEYEFAHVSRSDDPLRYETGTIARRQIEALGFQTEHNVVDTGTYVDKLNGRDFDFMIAAWTGGTERLFPYYNLFFSFHSSFADPEGGNYTMFESEEYDEAVENFTAAVDEEERVEWSNLCQEILAENVPILFTIHPDDLIAGNIDEFENWQSLPGLDSYNNTQTLRNLENVGGSDQVVMGATETLSGMPNFYDIARPSHRMLADFIYDNPVRLDFNGEPIPGAAEDWEWVDDTTIDVTLRSDLTFHDGEPCTVEDLQFTFDDIQETGIAYLGSDIDPYESSEILDDNTLRFNLSEPFSGFVQISLYRIPILPKHIWDGVAEEEGLEHPSEWTDPDLTGSGPFVFESYDPETELVYSVNPDHYMADEFEFDQFIYRLYGSQSAIIGDLEAGTIHCTQYLTTEHYNQVADSPSLEAVNDPGLDAHGVWVPNDREIFEDVRVRKALAYAIDTQEIIDILLQGNGERAKHPISPANDVYYNSDVPTYEHDINRARELLSDAGFRWDEEGNLVKPIDWEPEVTYISPD